MIFKEKHFQFKKCQNLSPKNLCDKWIPINSFLLNIFRWKLLWRKWFWNQTNCTSKIFLKKPIFEKIILHKKNTTKNIQSNNFWWKLLLRKITLQLMQISLFIGITIYPDMLIYRHLDTRKTINILNSLN